MVECKYKERKDMTGKMVRGEHSLTPIEFIQELLSRVSETYYAVEEACTEFLDSYDEQASKGNVEFPQCSRYIEGMIPITLVDTSKNILVSVDTYGDPCFLGVDGDWHGMEHVVYSGDDESKYASQSMALQKAVEDKKQRIALLQKELDELLGT